jgi:hypothetical protein
MQMQAVLEKNDLEQKAEKKDLEQKVEKNGLEQKVEKKDLEQKMALENEKRENEADSRQPTKHTESTNSRCSGMGREIGCSGLRSETANQTRKTSSRRWRRSVWSIQADRLMQSYMRRRSMSRSTKDLSIQADLLMQSCKQPYLSPSFQVSHLPVASPECTHSAHDW